MAHVCDKHATDNPLLEFYEIKLQGVIMGFFY